MSGPDPEITIDSMFAADPGFRERQLAAIDANLALSRALFGDPVAEAAVDRLLRDALGYDPPIAYNVD